MVADRGRSYNSHSLSGVRQRQRMAHVPRSISEESETNVGRGRAPNQSRGHGFGRRLTKLMRESERRAEPLDFGADAERLKRDVFYRLRDRPMPNPDNQRLLNEFGRRDDRDNLL